MAALQASSGSLQTYLGLALVSGSVLGLQVVFTRIFSIMIWYHFTYLIIGVALLGTGAGGTFLAVKRWNTETLMAKISTAAVAFSLSVLACLAMIALVSFDPLSGGVSTIPGTILGLAVYFVVLFFTFFLGGIVIAGVFSAYGHAAHRLYFADLLGASAITLLINSVVQVFSGPGAIALVALIALLAAALLNARIPRGVLMSLLVLELAIFAWVTFIQPLQLAVPPSKELGFVLRRFELDKPEYTRWNPVARVDVSPEFEVDQPFIVGGVSEVAFEETRTADGQVIPPQERARDLRFVTLDGTSMTVLYPFDGENLEAFRFLEHSVVAAPFHVVNDAPTVLNIGVGGGVDILLARLYNASIITAIDINSDVVELLTGPYATYTGRLADHPSTQILVAEGRSFLTRTTEQYDLIQGIGLDNFAALSGGAYVLSESYIYTVEAFDLAYQRLNPEGIFAWTRGTDNPPREMLRLTGVAAAALRQQGIANPAAHLAIVANDDGGTATLLMARQPFTASALENLRIWAASNRFSLLHDPLQPDSASVYTHYLTTPDRAAFEAAYPFQIYPVTDDHPFFYNYFRWTNLTGLEEGDVNNRLPIGNLILMTMLIFTLIAVAAFIVVPLVRYQRDGLQTPGAVPMLGYFSLLGMAYIFVEIVMIQRITLFIGYPTYAITTTIFAMLFSSALGALASARLIHTQTHLQTVLLVITVTIGLYIVGLPLILNTLLAQSDQMRILISGLIVAPLAFLMGMPFPTGLRQIVSHTPMLVPWAWGMNGVFSVLGSTLVIIVSMAFNFTASLAAAAVFYAGAALLCVALWRLRIVETAEVDTMLGAPTGEQYV